MKIKRFNNLWTMGLILCGVILGIIYFLKLFFPQTVIEIAQIDSITKIGHYIDNHKWAWYLVTTILSIFSYYFICCACCSKKTLTNKELLIVLGTIVFLYIVKAFLPMLYTPLNMCSNIVLPMIFNATLKRTSFVFCAVTILQALTVEIRGIIYNISDFNFATLLILMIDIYILEVLLYLSSNFKKEIN